MFVIVEIFPLLILMILNSGNSVGVVANLLSYLTKVENVDVQTFGCVIFYDVQNLTVLNKDI